MNPDKDDLEYVSFLEDLIEGDRLEDAALGIAKQAVSKGPDTLSTKQRAVLEGVTKQFITEKCSICGSKIPWPEMYQAIDSGRCLGCISR